MLFSVTIYPTTHVILNNYQFLPIWLVNSGVIFKELTKEEKCVVTSCRTMPWVHKENFSLAA
jgi:hypothetical protein